MCTDHTLYLPPFLRTHPYLITISQPPTRATHNIFPIRWLGVLKATIKLRSSNLRSRQMDAGFSGRWLRGRPSSSKPLSPLVFSPSRVCYRRLGQKRNAWIWRSRVQRLSGEGRRGEGDYFEYQARGEAGRGGGVGCLQLLGGLLG